MFSNVIYLEFIILMTVFVIASICRIFLFQNVFCYFCYIYIICRII